MANDYPTIEPGLKVRYRADGPLSNLAGEVRVVHEVVHKAGRDLIYLHDEHGPARAIPAAEFWAEFEPVKVDVDSREGDGSDDEGGPERPDGVWVVWLYNDGPEVTAIYPADDELGALRQAVGDGHKVTYVDFGQDISDALR